MLCLFSLLDFITVTFALLAIALGNRDEKWGFMWPISEKWVDMVSENTCLYGKHRGEAEESQVGTDMGFWAGKGQRKPR